MHRKACFGLLVLVVVLALGLGFGPSDVAAAPPPPSAPAPAPAAPLPAPAAPPPYGVYHVVRQGENLTRIALYYGTSVSAISQVNNIWNIHYIRAGQVLLIPGGVMTPPPPRYHVVQRGDTLTAIAWRYGATAWVIAQANGIWNPNLIYVGQVLYMP